MTEPVKTVSGQGSHHGQRSVRRGMIVTAWLGAFAGIGVLAAAVSLFPDLRLLVIGSFGASAVLLCGAPMALIAVAGSDAVHSLSWGYVFPVMIGATILLLIALISNNAYRPGSYPQRWD